MDTLARLAGVGHALYAGATPRFVGGRRHSHYRLRRGRNCPQECRLVGMASSEWGKGEANFAGTPGFNMFVHEAKMGCVGRCGVVVVMALPA